MFGTHSPQGVVCSSVFKGFKFFGSPFGAIDQFHPHTRILRTSSQEVCLCEEMFSRGTVRTGTPKIVQSTETTSSVSKKEGRVEGSKSPRSHALVFISAVLTGMVLTILSFSYYEHGRVFNDEPMSHSVEGESIVVGESMGLKGRRPSFFGSRDSAGNSPPSAIIADGLAKQPKKTVDQPVVGNHGLANVNIVQAREQATELLKKAKTTLKWLAGQEIDKSPESSISWTRLSNAEVHLLYKIEEYLEFYLSPANMERFNSLLAGGFECDAVQQEQQTIISKVIAMDICSEVEWYKLAHFTYPNAKTMFDVGGNKGYLGSLFLSLWGGGGHGVSPAALLQKTAREGTWEGSRNPAGYCKDGFNHGVPYYCPSDKRQSNAQCVENRDITVTSFDGSGYISKTLNNLIKTFEGASQEVRNGSAWKYLHHAVSDTEGTAYFWAGPKIKEANAGFEGGKLRGGQGSDTEEVQMITIDSYMQRTGLTSVDIIKIDAEGNDNKVIRGARKAIDGGAALFTFEGGSGVSFTKDDIDDLDSRGFSCYSTSRAGLFRWSGGCMSETYMGPFRAKDKGNIFCTSRVRAPVMAVMFDALSFPMLIEQRVREGVSPTGSRPKKNAFPRDNKVSERFTEVYVNVKPFCQPFPVCAAAAAI